MDVVVVVVSVCRLLLLLLDAGQMVTCVSARDPEELLYNKDLSSICIQKFPGTGLKARRL